MPENKIKITPAKGRPMLNWIGKKPLDYVKSFPTQLIEYFNPLKKEKIIEIPYYEELKNNWHNLLFHGDNKDVISTLLELGFRGKIDLVYIDPPFKSGADYIRRIELRGLKNLGKIEEDNASVLQQTMYFDIWNNDSYLQFMYERLQLLKELLADTGSIFVHLDWHVSHYIKLIMDEIFGEENFINEIIWQRKQSQAWETNRFGVTNDTILFYSKSYNHKLNPIYTKEDPDTQKYINERFIYHDEDGRKYMKSPLINPLNRPNLRYEFHGIKYPPTGWLYSQEKLEMMFKNNELVMPKSSNERIYRKIYLDQYKGQMIQNIWTDIPIVNPMAKERLGFETQKPEALINRILHSSSDENDLVLDCFIGSGTTARVAQKLSRRWIGCDINKGAVHLTSRELQKIINQKIKNIDNIYPNFAIYKVNNYDLKLLQTEAIDITVQYIGIQRSRTDRFFDGILGKTLAKIIDFNHPLTMLDLQLLKDELIKRPDEDRDITVVCLGKELSVDPDIEDWNKKHPINKIRIIELKTDKKYGSFLIYKPAEAKILIERKNDKSIIEIQNFISPTIIERLNIDNSLFKVKIPDFRSMIDCVLIDNNYNDKIFQTVFSDVPEKKNDLVKGKYEIEIPKEKVKIAVKIVDMLGEEVLFVKEI